MEVNNNISDNELVEKVRKGDTDAFDLIFKRYGDRLYGFALSYLKSKEETEGLVQDVFLKIWENRKNLKKESSLKSYLFTITYHHMCQLFRKKRIHERFLEEASMISESKIYPEEQIEYKTTLEQIDKLIDKLPEKQKIIFTKSRKEGKSSKEIAVEMNLSPGTVDNQVSAALKFLRKHISENKFALLLYLSVFI